MRIGVLGAGRIVEALVPHWTRAGHDVMLSGRTPEKAAALAGRLGVRVGTPREAARFGDVVLLAVLYQGIDATLEAAGAGDGVLAGKVLIDCNNPVEVEDFTLVDDFTPSLAEYLAATTGARVVKALHQVHADVWEHSVRFAGRALAVPMAGEAEAKETVAELVRDAGAEPIDAGELAQARNLEAMTAVIIRLLWRGADPRSAFQLTVGSAVG